MLLKEYYFTIKPAIEGGLGGLFPPGMLEIVNIYTGECLSNARCIAILAGACRWASVINISSPSPFLPKIPTATPSR